MKLATRLVNRYELIQSLSSSERQKAGKYTFLSRDIQTREQVVVKILQLEQAIQIADQWVDLKLFERESNILKALQHPAVPAYKDVFETEIEGVRSFGLVQTYLEADSLETRIQSGQRFSESEILDIAKRLLTLLNYLHTQTPPIIHRDIKPSNVLLSEKGDIYLIDFGSVHTDLTKESGTITIVGSYGYIPLEQFTGRAVPASDLYSLGMTLVYLTTGVHPADIAFVDGQIQLPRHSVGPSLMRWLEKMTAPYLDRRFDSAEQALLALESRESKQGHYPNLKPEGTEIELIRERDRLQIWMDKPKCQPSERWVNFVCAIAFIMLLFTISVFAFFLTGFLKKGVEFSLSKLLSLFSTHRKKLVFEIDREEGIRKGTRRNHQATVKWDSRFSYFQDIDLLAYNPGYTFKSYTKGDKTIRQRGDGMSPKLSVHAGEATYTVGHSQLSSAEFWWLAQELSDFLDLELQTIYPMPIVTVSATSTCGC